MPIKMRNNPDDDSLCCNCGCSRSEALEMFDLCIGETVVTICDECNELILTKTLKAECLKNGRVKSGHDMQIIRKRGQLAFEDRQWERAAAGRGTQSVQKGRGNGKTRRR